MDPASDPTGATASRRSWLKTLGGLFTGGLLLGNRRPARAEPLAPEGYQQFIGEIMMISWTYAPKGWAFCNGQLLPVNQNQALFSLLGTTYGGNGMTTFGLPDLRGRIPVAQGGSFSLGQRAGTETHTITTNQLVPHQHGIRSSTELGRLRVSGTSSPLAHHYPADSGGGDPQYGLSPNASLATTDADGGLVNTSTAAGDSQAHSNLQPYLGIHFVIALEGIFPSSN